MTLAEQKASLDEAVALLKGTTVGWANHSAAWQANQTTKWWQALDRIRKVRESLDPEPTPPPTPPAPSGSVWTTPIPPNPSIAPVSAAYVDELVNQRQSIHQYMVVKSDYAIPRYVATAQTPRVNVPLTWDNTGRTLTNVPLDPSWRPSPGDDQHMAIIDLDGCEINFWGFDFARKTARSAIAFAPGGSRFTSTRNACRAGGSALLAGTILRSEMDAGRIPHALAFSTQTPTRHGSVVFPATDGWADNLLLPGPRIPIGARVQLDPAIPINATTVPNRGDRIVLTAMQEFGMYCIDGGGFGVIAEDELTAGKYPDWPTGSARMLPSALKKHLRVLAYGPPLPRMSAGYNGPETCTKSRVI